MRLSAFMFFVVLLFEIAAFAEYRAFELEITSQTSGARRYVTSNLDDLQYRGYYPVRQDELIKINDTWMCRGRTGDYRGICPSPRAKSSSP